MTDHMYCCALIREGGWKMIRGQNAGLSWNMRINMGSASKRLQTHSHLHVLISIVSPGIQTQLPLPPKKKHFVGGSCRENNRGTRSALICGTVFPRFIPLVSLCYQGKLRFGNGKPSSDDPVEVVLHDLTYDVLRFHTSVQCPQWLHMDMESVCEDYYSRVISHSNHSSSWFSSSPLLLSSFLCPTPLLRPRRQVWFNSYVYSH